MTQDIAMHVHIHIHEGASPEAVRAGVEAARPIQSVRTEPVANGEPEADPEQFLDAVRRAYTDSYAKATPLLEFLADNPDRWVPFGEVSRALGFTNNRSLPGLLGAFGRRAKHRYGGRKPFEARQLEGNWHMRMSPEAAKVINDLR